MYLCILGSCYVRALNCGERACGMGHAYGGRLILSYLETTTLNPTSWTGLRSGMPVQPASHASYACSTIGASQKLGHHKDYRILGSILGSPLSWETTTTLLPLLVLAWHWRGGRGREGCAVELVHPQLLLIGRTRKAHSWAKIWLNGFHKKADIQAKAGEVMTANPAWGLCLRLRSGSKCSEKQTNTHCQMKLGN